MIVRVIKEVYAEDKKIIVPKTEERDYYVPITDSENTRSMEIKYTGSSEHEVLVLKGTVKSQKTEKDFCCEELKRFNFIANKDSIDLEIPDCDDNCYLDNVKYCPFCGTEIFIVENIIEVIE